HVCRADGRDEQRLRGLTPFRVVGVHVHKATPESVTAAAGRTGPLLPGGRETACPSWARGAPSATPCRAGAPPIQLLLQQVESRTARRSLACCGVSATASPAP